MEAGHSSDRHVAVEGPSQRLLLDVPSLSRGCIRLCNLVTINNHPGHVAWPLAEADVEVTIDPLVGEQSHLCHFSSFGVGGKEPPVKAVVIIETEVELKIFRPFKVKNISVSPT